MPAASWWWPTSSEQQSAMFSKPEKMDEGLAEKSEEDEGEVDLDSLVSLDCVDESEFEEMVRGSELQTLLWDACGAGRLGVLDRIVSHSEYLPAMLENEDPETGRRAIHAACEAGSAPAVLFLLRHGADGNGRTCETKGWRSPLHVAALGGQWQCCRALLSKGGARIDARTPDGRTALHLASESGSPETVKAVLKKHLVQARDDEGRSPLHHACASQSTEAAAILVEAGADLAALDAAGRSPLDVARIAGAKKKLIFLLSGSEGDEEDEEVDEAPLWFLVDAASGNMVETRDRRVALFVSPAAAWRWRQREEIDEKSVPAMVRNVRDLQSAVACERIELEEEDEEDRAFVDFLKRSKLQKESGQDGEEAEALDRLRKAEKSLQDLRAGKERADAETEALELKLVTLFSTCQRLEAATKAHDAALRQKHGDLLETARALANAHHPAARDDADPARFAAACAALVRQRAAERKVSQQQQNSVSTGDIETSSETVVDPTPSSEDAVTMPTTAPSMQTSREDVPTAIETQGAPTRDVDDQEQPSSTQETPTRTVTEPDDDDDDDEDDIELLRELERELSAAGVRRHAKAAKLLHSEEVTWDQLRAVFALSGPDGLKRTLKPLGLTAGALTSIELRITSLARVESSS